MNHSMKLTIFNVFVSLKLFSIAETKFTSIIVMLKRFKLIKQALHKMVISQERNTYRDNDQKKITTVKSFILDYLWWDKIDYIINFTNLIYEVLLICDIDSPTLYLVYDIWDTMIKKVKEIIYRRESIIVHHSFKKLQIELLFIKMKKFLWKEINIEDRKKVALEFSKFSIFGGVFSSFDSIVDRWELHPQS
ncbi:hypothetical protein HN51_041024 [Arachis hypogaea]